MQNNLICLMGPTASGKTDLALNLLNHIDGEIVSVDSALIYQDMSIGSAKPSLEILNKYPHHLVNIINPVQSYSAATFCNDARRVIIDILNRNKTPILVGGTMLYFNALQYGLSKLPGANEEVREKILDEANQYGWKTLHAKLNLVDEQSFKRINVNDKQRIQRALEVHYITGRSLTELSEHKIRVLPEFEFKNIVLMPPHRKILHAKIEDRFKSMLENGLVDEVKLLRKKYILNLNMPSMRSVGYRHVWQYLEGEYSFNTMQQKAIASTRQLAKRQLTWLRSWSNIHVLSSQEEDLTKKVLDLIIN